MSMSEKELESLKKVELGILKDFLCICQELNLKYYILGGTLLGAVRHKGFIPWDDDIDVGMLRPEFEIFLKEAPKYLAENLFLQTHQSDPNYLNGFAKIRDTNTAFIQRSVQDVAMHHGMFIDIFPLDYYSAENNKKFQHSKFVLDERMWMESIATKYRPLMGKIVRPYAKLRYPTIEDAFIAREKLFHSKTQQPYIANHCGAWGEKEIVPAEWYAEGTMLEFEGLQVMAPKEYDKWLTQVYGDYMQLPPEEKRVTHHDTVVIDTENSYLNYMNR